MESKKLPNNIPTEDLISALSDPSIQERTLEKTRKQRESEALEQENLTREASIASFIKEFNIRPGKYKVQMKLLYRIYKAWNKTPNPSTDLFYDILRETFKHDGVKVYINLTSLSLTTNSLALFKDSPKWVPISHRKTHGKHFENFLKHYSIIEGDRWVYGFLLYYLYDKWVYKTKFEKPLKRNNFYWFCREHFRCMPGVRGKVFRVNTETYNNFTDKEIEEITNSIKRHAKK